MAKCRLTVVQKTLFPDLISRYCDPNTVPCEIFEEGQSFEISREDYFAMRLPEGFCSEAWTAIHHYLFAMFEGGMPSWAVDNSILACCNDGARPVVFRIEKIED